MIIIRERTAKCSYLTETLYIANNNVFPSFNAFFHAQKRFKSTKTACLFYLIRCRRNTKHRPVGKSLHIRLEEVGTMRDIVKAGDCADDREENESFSDFGGMWHVHDLIPHLAASSRALQWRLNVSKDVLSGSDCLTAGRVVLVRVIRGLLCPDCMRCLQRSFICRRRANEGLFALRNGIEGV